MLNPTKAKGERSATGQHLAQNRTNIEQQLRSSLAVELAMDFDWHWSNACIRSSGLPVGSHGIMGRRAQKIHQKEKIYDIRSRTVSRKHFLQSNFCKLFGWISSFNAKLLAHRHAKKEEWDTAESSTVLFFLFRRVSGRNTYSFTFLPSLAARGGDFEKPKRWNSRFAF